MIEFLSKLLYVTRGSHQSSIVIILLFILISGLEVFGTGLIGPFITLSTRPDSIRHNFWLNSIYQQLSFNSEQHFLIFVGGLVIVAFYVKAFLSFKAQKAVFAFGYKLRGNLSHQLMTAYMSAPYSFHLRTNSATIVQNIVTTTDMVCIGLVMSFLTSISNAVIVIALAILLVKTNIMALTLIATIVPVGLGLLHPMKERLALWGREGWQAGGEMIRIVNHGLGSLKETRVIGCEAYFDERMLEQTKRYAINSSLAAGYGNLPRYVVEAFLITFLVIFTLFFVSFNRESGQDLTAVLGIFALASIRLLPAFGSLISGINVIRTNTHALDRLYFDFKELEKERVFVGRDRSKYTQHTWLDRDCSTMPFEDKITLDRIVFRYPGTTKNALDGINLIVGKGESIGLIGKSGSGKTTLVDVLLGLFVPESGDIQVDGVSVSGNLRAWQNKIGYVPQSIFLIDDTLERNIAFGVPDDLIDRDKLNKAIEMAQLQEVVEQLPDGLQTIVGERGVLFSGGQRQRVGIARVLYHEREVLVFDEATAALDNETEHLVTDATKALAGKKTIIIIAHRLSTLEHCDRIYQIDRGKAVASGSYQEVILGQDL
jgi:ATP-binding cassette, subfamily B, bacterial PglK